MTTSATEGPHTRLCIPPHDDPLLPRMRDNDKTIQRKPRKDVISIIITYMVIICLMNSRVRNREGTMKNS